MGTQGLRLDDKVGNLSISSDDGALATIGVSSQADSETIAIVSPKLSAAIANGTWLYQRGWDSCPISRKISFLYFWFPSIFMLRCDKGHFLLSDLI